jgi:hypothetical protein
LPVEKISSASSSASGRIASSRTSMPAPRSRAMTRRRVMPSRKVPFGTGVLTTPSLTSIRLAEANSQTFPSRSHTTALSKPRSRANFAARAEFG